MQLPEADSATIAPEKIRDHLLSASHPVGRFKATSFLSSDSRKISDRSWRSRFASMLGAGIVWIVSRGDTVPRFVTAYPGV